MFVLDRKAQPRIRIVIIEFVRGRRRHRSKTVTVYNCTPREVIDQLNTLPMFKDTKLRVDDAFPDDPLAMMSDVERREYLSSTAPKPERAF